MHYEVTVTQNPDDSISFACQGAPNENDLASLINLEGVCADCGIAIGLHEADRGEYDSVEWRLAFWSSVDAKLRCEDCSIEADER